MQPVKKKLTEPEKQAILELARKGKGIVEIARELKIHGHVVNGFISTARRRGLLLTAPPGVMPPMPPRLPTQEEQLRELAKSWSKSEPDAEFSINMAGGQKLYIAAYNEGGGHQGR